MPMSLVTTSSRSERPLSGKIEKLMEELRTARDYLRSEGERVRRINAHYAHLTRTASASVKIIAESMGKWRTTEIEAAK
jgi:predicted  nucleic acid-binding Zn-ribbon protein